MNHEKNHKQNIKRWMKDDVSQSDVERGVRCAKCGGKVCVCPVDLKETNWWAHCRDCDNDIEITETKQEAIDAWAELNKRRI